MVKRSHLTRKSKGVFGTRSMDFIFENNKKWVDASLADDPMVFERLKNAQQPTMLYIGCSDSRVPAQNMLGLTLGQLFVHRNVANLCINTDFSLLSVLTYAVEVLKVTDIIVCGHYNCGGVRAAMENEDHGLLEHWLTYIRNVQRLHQAELQEISDPELRHQRLVELNVQEQCMSLFANPIVQRRQAQEALPRIHGWVYDVATGLLKDVKIDFKAEIRKYKDIYRLYDFPRGSGNRNMSPKRAVGHVAKDDPLDHVLAASAPSYSNSNDADHADDSGAEAVRAAVAAAAAALSP
ncbi:unnamed protein product [Phaeothamnion confervicola]